MEIMKFEKEYHRYMVNQMYHENNKKWKSLKKKYKK